MQINSVTIRKFFYQVPFTVVAVNNTVSEEYEYFKGNKQQADSG